MVDYFEKASFIIPLADEEVSTVREMVAMLKMFVEKQELCNDAPTTIGPYPSMNALCQYIIDDEKDFLTNEYELQEEEGDCHLWGTHDERFDVDEAALLTQAILLQFDKKGHIGFQWSCDCSKPRLDAYGGGACVITAQGWDYSGTADVLESLTKALNAGELLNVED